MWIDGRVHFVEKWNLKFPMCARVACHLTIAQAANISSLTLMVLENHVWYGNCLFHQGSLFGVDMKLLSIYSARKTL
jgi:hypothetical protein